MDNLNDYKLMEEFRRLEKPTVYSCIDFDEPIEDFKDFKVMKRLKYHKDNFEPDFDKVL